MDARLEATLQAQRSADEALRADQAQAPVLAVPLSPHEGAIAIKAVAAPPVAVAGPEDDAVVATPPTLEDGPPLMDEAAEAAFLGEARERGEVVPQRAASESEDEASPKSLPPLDELLKRIPADIREKLEDLFRARFTTVKRFPKKALK